MDYLQKLEEDEFYHVYNKAVDLNLLFKEKANYYTFLERFKKFLSRYVKVYAYCLLPNHFHFLIKVRERGQLEFSRIDLAYIETNSYANFLSKQFSNFFNSYSRSFNNKYNRTGNLFLRPFKRRRITNEDYFTQIIYYIHRNPIHHF